MPTEHGWTDSGAEKRTTGRRKVGDGVERGDARQTDPYFSLRLRESESVGIAWGRKRGRDLGGEFADGDEVGLLFVEQVALGLRLRDAEAEVLDFVPVPFR